MKRDWFSQNYREELFQISPTTQQKVLARGTKMRKKEVEKEKEMTEIGILFY